MSKTKIILAAAVFTALFFSLAGISVAQSCVKAQPTVIIFPKEMSGVPGSTVAYEISVKNNDLLACDPSTFNTVINSGGYASFLSKNSVTLAPNQEQKIMLNIQVPSSATSGTKDVIVTASSGNYQATDNAKLIVIEEPKSCTLSVDLLEVTEKDDNTAKNLFCEDLTLKVKTKVSVSGGTGTSSLVQLYVGGNLFDTKNVILSPGSFAGFTFNRLVDTKALGLSSFEVKVVAKSSCDVEGNSISQTVSTESCNDKCEFSTYVAKPDDRAIGEKVGTNVVIKNVGGVDDEAVNIITLMCSSDSSGECKTMSCDSSSFSVNHGEVKNIKCSATADKEGTYKVKLNSVTCGKTNTDFSNDFIVSSVSSAKAGCDQTLSNKLKCSGNVIQKSQLKSDCSVEWSDIEYCPFGCSNGSCASPVETLVKSNVATVAEETSPASGSVSSEKSEVSGTPSLFEYAQIAAVLAVIVFVLFAFPKKIFGKK